MRDVSHWHYGDDQKALCGASANKTVEVPGPPSCPQCAKVGFLAA